MGEGHGVWRNTDDEQSSNGDDALAQGEFN